MVIFSMDIQILLSPNTFKPALKIISVHILNYIFDLESKNAILRHEILTPKSKLQKSE